jgi:hypothetical protein
MIRAFARPRASGYAAAFMVPVALTYVCTWLNVPPFVFEHLVVLLVLAVAVPWGLGPAVVAAIVSVASDNVLLHEPIGRPTITGYRDVLIEPNRDCQRQGDLPGADVFRRSSARVRRPWCCSPDA